MASISFSSSLKIATRLREIDGSIVPIRPSIDPPAVNFPFTLLSIGAPSRVATVPRSHPRSSSNPQRSENKDDDDDDDSESYVDDLRIPDHWLAPSKAVEESEWLRITLHKWLDEEYCPEATNVEISNVAARAFYDCLLRKETDIGEILLSMARELETISYQESFHGAFTSANAAVSLIYQRMERA